MSKHTPGPWHDVMPLYPEGTSAHKVITGGPDGLPHIAYIPKNGYAATADEALANARLIAAAPDLLTAASKGLGFVEHALEFFGWSQFPSLRAEVEALRDLMGNAVAKATS